MSYLQLRLVALVNRLWFEVCVNQYEALRRYESIVRASNQSRLFRCHNLDAFYLRSTSALRTGLVEGKQADKSSARNLLAAKLVSGSCYGLVRTLLMPFPATPKHVPRSSNGK